MGGGLGTQSAGPYATKKSSFSELVACGHCFYTGFRASVQTVYAKAYMYAFGILVVTWTASPQTAKTTFRCRVMVLSEFSILV